MSSFGSFTRFLPDEAATVAAGAKIGRALNTGCVVFLVGELGAGKTTFTRGALRALGHAGSVKSPTYTLCEEYDLDEFLFLHIDLYRTNEAQDIDIFNLDRVLYKKKIVLIEWPERLQLQRKYDLKIDFFHLENKRKINIIYGTDVFKTLEVKYE